MEQYTLLIMGENKVVRMVTFLTMKALLEYKRYVLDNNLELKQVDKYGYVWFVEFDTEEAE